MDEIGFVDVLMEERICGEGLEGVVLDFGVCWRCVLVNEVEIVVCREDWCVEEDKLDIYL